MTTKFSVCVAFIALLFTVSGTVKGQSQFSFIPGIFYNGQFFDDEVYGFGVIAGLEYKPRANHFFSLELRTRYGVYGFDDGTRWKIDDDGSITPPNNWNAPRLEYTVFSPQVSIVPRFHVYTDDIFSLFLENEFSSGLITGKFTYGGDASTKTTFTEPIFNYNVAVGFEYNTEKNWYFLASIGYSTLNFREKIRKHEPPRYDGWIPNQDALIIVNVLFKIPFGKKKRDGRRK